MHHLLWRLFLIIYCLFSCSVRKDLLTSVIIAFKGIFIYFYSIKRSIIPLNFLFGSDYYKIGWNFPNFVRLLSFFLHFFLFVIFLFKIFWAANFFLLLLLPILRTLDHYKSLIYVEKIKVQIFLLTKKEKIRERDKKI